MTVTIESCKVGPSVFVWCLVSQIVFATAALLTTTSRKMLHDAQVVDVDIVVLVLVVVVVVTVVCVVLTFLFAIQRRYFIADFSRIWLLSIGSRFKLVHRKIVFFTPSTLKKNSSVHSGCSKITLQDELHLFSLNP